MPRTDEPLHSGEIVAFIATSDPGRAKAFYQHTLGFVLQSEDPFALVFDVHGTMLRVTTVPQVTVAPYTVLGLQVPDIDKALRSLVTAGIKFERYQGMPQDERGIWQSPNGAKVAWFKDPDGHTLSVTQFSD
jgi:predicted enzyme related to lactoylglutathione lyase